MTPKAMIFTEMGLPVPGRNDIRTWLHVDGMEAHGSLRMIQALRLENDNLRGGIQAIQAASEELAEANANQRRYIQELEAKLKISQAQTQSAYRALGWQL